MKRRRFAAAVSTATLLSSGIGLAGQATAAPATPTTTYSMPAVIGMTLENADKAIVSLSPDTTFSVTPLIKGDEPTRILSPGSWLVCRQSPAAGNRVSAKSNIRLRVERPWNGC